ncbi:hypothetical protein FA869_06455 [Halopseudomonas bauzanensis]|uniref:Uncharacterized protein n=1 Tax=Halopseudomonas bauzanensis TaxID=653930 RepID=A0A4U0YP96_9GAMM|nr:hypothetical protein FA869_06455 [Halopseudomonas bauzanensis]
MKGEEKYFVIQALSEEIAFLQSFLSQQERQIHDYCENFEKYVEEVEAEQFYWLGSGEPEMIMVPIRHVDGIMESDYDIKGVFTEILPIYQRQSMLITLWARFEVKLKDIVSYLHSERSTKPRKKAKNESVFAQNISELTHFGIDFSGKDLLSVIDSLDNIVRPIRNCWVHDGGIAETTKIKSLIEKSKNLSVTDGLVNVSSAYLYEVGSLMSLLASHIYHEIGIRRKC